MPLFTLSRPLRRRPTAARRTARPPACLAPPLPVPPPNPWIPSRCATRAA